MTEPSQTGPISATDPPAPTVADAPMPAAVALPPPPIGPPISSTTSEFLATPPLPPRQPTPLSPRWLIAAGAAAVVADVTLRHAPWNNVAGSLLITVMAVGLLASGFVTGRAARAMAGAAIFFGLFLAVRTEPMLSTFNMVAAISLLVLAAIHGRGRPFLDLRPLRLAADAGVVFVEGAIGIVEVPAEVAARFRVAKEQADDGRASALYAAAKGLAIAAPIVLLFGLLLASADVVFSSFFGQLGILNPGVLIGHLVLAAIGAYAMMVLLRLAKLEGATDPISKAPSLGHIETAIVLISVNLLFAAFAVAQIMTVVGGADAALERSGLDPKYFARQGFFQLLWVAGLTLILLMVLHVATSENEAARRLTANLSLVTVGLTILIVVAAVVRIAFYVEDGGLTPLRLYSLVFSLWVALAFIMVAVRIRGFRPNQAWLLPVMLLSGLVVLGLLNLANPERVIALDNINRDHDALRWHVVEGQFSGDGQAVLATEMDRLSPEVAENVTAELCNIYRRHESRGGYRSGWLDFNLGKWRANNSLPELCADR